MSLPKQVQAQLDEATRYDQLIQDQMNPTSDPSPAPTDGNTSQEPPAAPAPAPVEPPKADPSEVEQWKHKFNTLQGKYNAEVPRLQAELKTYKDTLNETTARLEALVKAQATDPATKLVTEKDVEAFGPELLDIIKRQATEVAERMTTTKMTALEQENARLKAQIDGVTTRQVSNDRAAYTQTLTQLVPDWVPLNTDEGFLGWIEAADPLSGRPIKELLLDAYNQFDANRTAHIFNSYKATRSPAPAPAPTPQNSTQRQLERQVAPGNSKSSVAPVAAEPRSFTSAEVEAFYRAVSKGEYKGRETEAARVEAEIDAAAQEGRIR